MIIHFSLPLEIDEESSSASSRLSKKAGASKLKHRDLRRLEYQFNPLGEPSILVRRHAVLISLDPIRVIIMADRLIMIIPDGADSLLQVLDRHLNCKFDFFC